MGIDPVRAPGPQVYAASLTPCTDTLEIDHLQLAAHIKWLLTNGCDGVAFMGTTGEANSFSCAQRMEALENLLSSGIQAKRMMVGTGCSALRDTTDLTRHAISCRYH